MALLRYSISPMAHGLSTSDPQLYTDQKFSPSVINGRIEQGSFRKRWGYLLDRSLGRPVYDIVLYQTISANRYTLYLTDTDLIRRDTGGTWTYLTESYAAGTVTGITGTPKSTVEGDGSVDWVTAGAVASGDRFIMASDLAAHNEPNPHWATVESVSDLNTIVLTGVYGGSTTPGDYVIRKTFSVPTNERWSWAIVDDRFCFGNGNTPVMHWDGSGYARPLDAANANQARYMVEFGNRLVLADCFIDGARAPLTLKWCAFNDTDDWTSPTAGENPFFKTEDFLSGLAAVGPNLVVFKRDSYYIGSLTGINTAPFTFPTFKIGVGNVAPWSIGNCLDTPAWRGRDDFYIMNGDSAAPIGEPVRGDFLDYVSTKEQERIWVSTNHDINEIAWTSNTTLGKRSYVWNYKKNEWYVYSYYDNMTAAGTGAI